MRLDDVRDVPSNHPHSTAEHLIKRRRPKGGLHSGLWRTQFDKQVTNKIMERVLKQTIALVRRVERKTPWRDQQTEDDRLHTAIAKTLAGTLRWDPVRVDLERHLLGAIPIRRVRRSDSSRKRSE
jgi:hypothetical protein